MNQSRKRPFSKGFTIVELLVVIVVIAILAAISILSYSGVSDKARRASFSANANSILRKIAYKHAESRSFDASTIDESNLTDELNISVADYESISMYDADGSDYIYMVGKNTFENLVVCGTQGNIEVYNIDDDDCMYGGFQPL